MENLRESLNAVKIERDNLNKKLENLQSLNYFEVNKSRNLEAKVSKLKMLCILSFTVFVMDKLAGIANMFFLEFRESENEMKVCLTIVYETCFQSVPSLTIGESRNDSSCMTISVTSTDNSQSSVANK
ncbi:hypothetical protein H5410_015992 [Solanum commersonii]|uniref:Uncharacterized protein n=1 Tax=Solanum commersonii TaxID=4109 RepID=A0A9J5ZVE0_SOLCO|nr:hypothetical protein H5410_015992 [Solanum commersonii]